MVVGPYLTVHIIEVSLFQSVHNSRLQLAVLRLANEVTGLDYWTHRQVHPYIL